MENNDITWVLYILSFYELHGKEGVQATLIFVVGTVVVVLSCLNGRLPVSTLTCNFVVGIRHQGSLLRGMWSPCCLVSVGGQCGHCLEQDNSRR